MLYKNWPKLIIVHCIAYPCLKEIDRPSSWCRVLFILITPTKVVSLVKAKPFCTPEKQYLLYFMISMKFLARISHKCIYMKFMYSQVCNYQYHILGETKNLSCIFFEIVSRLALKGPFYHQAFYWSQATSQNVVNCFFLNIFLSFSLLSPPMVKRN